MKSLQGSCPGWQMDRGSSLWRCRTACSNVLVMRICPIPSLHRPFPVSFSPGLFLRAPFTQSEIFQLWKWLQSGIVLSFTALQSTEQGRRGSRWVLELQELQWAQLGAGDEDGKDGKEGLFVCLGLTVHGCCCPVPPWDEEGFAVTQLTVSGGISSWWLLRDEPPGKPGLLLLRPAAFPPHEQLLMCCLLLSSGTMSTASW